MAASAESNAIPMVFIGAADPVAIGLVSSFNHPGGNVTGVLLVAGDIPSKQMGLLQELLPRVTKVGLLMCPRFTASEPEMVAAMAAANRLGIDAIVERVCDETEFDSAFQRFAQARIDAVLAITNLFFASYRERLAKLALRQGLPFFASSRLYPVAGGLASYGTNTPDVIRQAGVYVGSILKGATGWFTSTATN
jgi:putative ABC transport system substrate-binding protein